MAKELKLAVIGVAGMGKSHIRGFQSHSGCKVVALCDVNGEVVRERAAEFGVAGAYTNAEKMLDEVRPDGVSIVTPNKFHAPLTLAALDRGAHVLCEKPMAMNTAEALEMQRKAVEKGLNLMINFSFRFSRSSFSLKRVVESGVIGEVYMGRTLWHRRYGPPGFGGWFGRKEMSGGGPLIDLGVHRLDLALWLMGYPDPVTVSGATFNPIVSRMAQEQGKEFDVEDSACGMIRFDNGAVLNIEASWALFIPEKKKMLTQLFGTRGGLLQTTTEGQDEYITQLSLKEDGKQVTRPIETQTLDVPSAYHEFVDSILEDRAPIATAEHGVKVMKILEGLYASAEKGREVVLTRTDKKGDDNVKDRSHGLERIQA